MVEKGSSGTLGGEGCGISLQLSSENPQAKAAENWVS